MESNHLKASCRWQRRWLQEVGARPASLEVVLVITLNNEASTSVCVLSHLLIFYFRAMLLLFPVGFFFTD